MQAEACANLSRAAVTEKLEQQPNNTDTSDSTNKFSNTQDTEQRISTSLSTSETFRSKPRIVAKQPDTASNT